MSGILGALRLPHLLGIGAIVAVLAGGVPSHWFGLAEKDVSEVQRLASCMQRHRVELTALVTSLGEPNELLSASPAQRARKVRAAERRGDLQRREGRAIVACASIVAPAPPR
jgi:hypothetical protein